MKKGRSTASNIFFIHIVSEKEEMAGGESSQKENVNKKPLEIGDVVLCRAARHVSPFAIPSGAPEPSMCEKPCCRLCA